MKKLLIEQALFLPIIFSSLSLLSQETVTLKYLFVKGKTYIQNTQVSNTVTQTVDGEEMKIESEINSTNEFYVENVEKDGSASVLVSLLKTSFRSGAMGVDTSMTFNALNNRTRVIYSKEGKPLQSSKADSTLSTKIYESMKNLSKLQILTGKSTRIGEKWRDSIVETKEISDVNPFAAVSQNKFEYTLTGKVTNGENEYIIKYMGTQEIKGNGNQMGMDMFIEGTGEIVGFSYFDPESSIVIYTEEQSEMNLGLAVTGQQNITIPIVQSIKTIIRIEEKK